MHTNTTVVDLLFIAETAACDDDDDDGGGSEAGSPRGFPRALVQVPGIETAVRAPHLALTLQGGGPGFRNSASRSARHKRTYIPRRIL